MNLCTYLECWGKTSAHEQESGSVHSGEAMDARALGGRPGLVVLCLQFQLLIFYKQPKRVVPIQDALECDFCRIPAVSDIDQNRSEAPHDLSRGLDLLVSHDNVAQYGRRSQVFCLGSLSRHV